LRPIEIFIIITEVNGLENNSNPRHLALYYKGIESAQEKNAFSANLSLNYLAVPNNLLLSLSLSLSLSLIVASLATYFLKHILSYAREDSRVAPVNKGLL